MKVNKITHGFVVQKFEDGKCIDQEFIAGDECEYETDEGVVEEPDNITYHPFDMVQPR